MFIQLILMLFLWKMIRTQKKTQEAFDELFIQIIKNHKEIYVGESKVIKSFQSIIDGLNKIVKQDFVKIKEIINKNDKVKDNILESSKNLKELIMSLRNSSVDLKNINQNIDSQKKLLSNISALLRNITRK